MDSYDAPWNNTCGEPIVHLKQRRKASDGSEIVPVHYAYKNSSSYYYYAWFIVDSLRGTNKPIEHNPDGFAYVKFYRWDKVVRLDELDANGQLEKRTPCSRWDQKTYKSYGLCHRKDGPAIVYHNNSLAGQFIGSDVNKEYGSWYKFGKPHRLDGPAFSGDSLTEWSVDGKLHRFNGPARVDISNVKKKKGKIRWHFMGDQIPDNIIRFEDGKPLGVFDKHSILEATLFNRDYGKIVNIVHSTNRIPSETEIYKILTGNDW